VPELSTITTEQECQTAATSLAFQ